VRALGEEEQEVVVVVVVVVGLRRCGLISCLMWV
jgi:hypothetical protein